MRKNKEQPKCRTAMNNDVPKSCCGPTFPRFSLVNQILTTDRDEKGLRSENSTKFWCHFPKLTHIQFKMRTFVE